MGKKIRVEAVTSKGRVFPSKSGEVYRIPGALPGDLLAPRTLTRTGNKHFVHTFERLARNPDRILPSCPAHQVCGGCLLMELEKGARARAKVALVRHAFAAANIAVPGISKGIDTGITTGAPAEYRRRIRMRIEHGIARFFNAEKLDRCEVLTLPLARACSEVRSRSKPQGLFKDAIYLEVRAPDRAGRPGLFVALAPDAPFEEAHRALQAGFPGWQVATERHPNYQSWEDWPGAALQVPVNGFLQVNEEMNRRVIESVVTGAEARTLSSFVDLCAGSGNFAVPLTLAGLKGVAVELHPESVAGLERTVAHLQLPIRCVTRAAESWVHQNQELFDLVLINPPRQGARFDLANTLPRIAKYLVYIACDPFTLARDLSPLLTKGGVLESIHCFDMFPQTAHVETAAWVRLKDNTRQRS